MADERPALLKASDARRVLRATDRVEDMPRSGSGPLRRTRVAGVPLTTTVRVTSGTPNGAGYYPAVITSKDATTGAWSDFGVVSVASPNAGTLVSGKRYRVTPAGIDPNDGVTPAMMTLEEPQGAAPAVNPWVRFVVTAQQVALAGAVTSKVFTLFTELGNAHLYVQAAALAVGTAFTNFSDFRVSVGWSDAVNPADYFSGMQAAVGYPVVGDVYTNNLPLGATVAPNNNYPHDPHNPVGTWSLYCKVDSAASGKLLNACTVGQLNVYLLYNTLP